MTTKAVRVSSNGIHIHPILLIEKSVFSYKVLKLINMTLTQFLIYTDPNKETK